MIVVDRHKGKDSGSGQAQRQRRQCTGTKAKYDGGAPGRRGCRPVLGRRAARAVDTAVLEEELDRDLGALRLRLAAGRGCGRLRRGLIVDGHHQLGAGLCCQRCVAR